MSLVGEQTVAAEGRTVAAGGRTVAAGGRTVAAEGRTDPTANPLATREELRAAQEEAADKAARKVERPYRFQKRAHEEQASFNDGLVDHISDAELQLAGADAGGRVRHE